MTKFKTNPSILTTERFGVTLIEVLMSLMIMSIGVVSVMSLFPIATLRSAQATKLTNSALLMYNVTALLDARPELVFDPNGNGNLGEHFRGARRNYVVDPLGFFSAFEYGNGGNPGRVIAETLGYNGTTAHPNGVPRFDGGVLNRLGINPATATNDQLRALRLIGARDSQLGDTWDTQFDFFLENPATDVVTDSNGEIVGIVIPQDVVPDAESLALVQTSATELPTTVPIIDPEVHRITLFSDDGRFSQSYPLLLVNGSRQAIWSESVVGIDVNRDGHVENRPIPREFQGVIGRVLIQSKRAADYTWMLTVRRSPDGQARGIDVVVRFGERLKLADEYLYPARFRPDLPIALSISGNSGAGIPALKRGGYVLDVQNARWYRIREFQIDEATGDFTITPERPLHNFGDAGALLLPGIIDVYPMGHRNMPL